MSSIRQSKGGAGMAQKRDKLSKKPRKLRSRVSNDFGACPPHWGKRRASAFLHDEAFALLRREPLASEHIQRRQRPSPAVLSQPRPEPAGMDACRAPSPAGLSPPSHRPMVLSAGGLVFRRLRPFSRQTFESDGKKKETEKIFR
jgi:hypothetical protein